LSFCRRAGSTPVSAKDFFTFSETGLGAAAASIAMVVVVVVVVVVVEEEEW